MKRKIVKGLKGVRSIADNIIVGGKASENHYDNLLALCERLKMLGITVGKENCTLGVKELRFFGLLISKDGVALSEDKIQALKSATQPATAKELRSFLGLAVYGGSFIPDLATIADPLWSLFKSDVFECKEEHKKAFKGVKQAVIKHPLSFFNPTWNTEVMDEYRRDASPCGLGAVLGQVNPVNQKDKKIVNFASKRLSDVKKRY